MSITASISSQVNDSVKIKVLPYNIESISIEGPLEQTLPVDQRNKENYKVLAYYDDSQNNPINITTSVPLTSTDSHVARAFVETNSFYIKAGALIGSAEIQAHYEGFSSEIISVDVEPYEITGITLEGLNNVIEVNKVQEFQIHAQYNNGFNSYPLTASRLLLSYDGEESSPHLMYGS